VDPKAFDPFCPARNVTAKYPPTMLLHGDKDTDVPFSQSEQMAAEFQNTACPSSSSECQAALTASMAA